MARFDITDEKIFNRCMRVFEFYVDCVVNEVKAEFGVNPIDGHREGDIQWFSDTVELLMEVDSDDVNISNPAFFTDTVASQKGEK